MGTELPCGCNADEDRAVLRAKLRDVTPSPRERQCGVVPCRQQGPAVQAVGKPGAWRAKWIGVATCGHIWTCPVCSAKLREERLAKVSRALEVGRGRWQMVTLTVRHRAGMPLRDLLRGLTASWRRARQGGIVQKLYGMRVSGSVRATEVTHGENGWHPHLHVLLRTTEWSPDEQDELERRWRAAVLQFLGPDCVPNDHGVRWSTPIDVSDENERQRANYIAKLGLEVAGGGKSRSSWQIAWRAARGDQKAVTLWREYYEGTRGRRMLELDDRAAAWAKTPRDIEPSEPTPDEQCVIVAVDPLELRALREYERRDPRIVAMLLTDVAECEDPRRTVTAWLTVVLRSLGPRASPRGS